MNTSATPWSRESARGRGGRGRGYSSPPYPTNPWFSLLRAVSLLLAL